MKKILSALLICLLFAACQSNKNKIIIEGVLNNATNEKIRLAWVTTDGLHFIDSMRLNKGQFHFEIAAQNDDGKKRLETPIMYQLMLSYDNTLTTLAQGGDHIVIEADARNLVRNYHVTGSEEAVLMGELDSALNAFVEPTENLFVTYQVNVENDSIRAAIEQEYLVLLENHKQYLTNFIQEHPNNMASYIAFYQSYNRRCFFNETENLDLLRQLTASLKQKYPENPYIQRMQQHIELLELQKQKIQ